MLLRQCETVLKVIFGIYTRCQQIDFKPEALELLFWQLVPAVGSWNVYLYEWFCSFTILFQNVGTT